MLIDILGHFQKIIQRLLYNYVELWYNITTYFFGGAFMASIRITCRQVTDDRRILRMEVGAQHIWEYKRTIDILIKVIEVSNCFKGYVFSPDDELASIESEVDENYNVVSGCFIKFISNEDVKRFLKSIYPDHGNG